MKNIRFALIVVSAGLVWSLAGCSKQADAKGEMEEALTALEAPAKEGDPAPAQAQPAAPVQPAAAAAPAPAPARQMSNALAAYKSGNLNDAVTRLQLLRAQPTMTPEQRIAVNDAIAAVMSEIYTLAEKGDARAIQAVKTYKQLQNQPH